MKIQSKHLEKGFTLIELLVVITIIAILASAAVPTFNSVQEKANQSNATSNAKQIILALRLYATDNNGSYPGSESGGTPAAANSNDAFRELFINGVLADEKIFTVKGSKYFPDGNIGDGPAYEEALKTGENHWAMTQDLSDSSPSITPLVYENPVDASWPPAWDVIPPAKKQKAELGKAARSLWDSTMVALRSFR